MTGIKKVILIIWATLIAFFSNGQAVLPELIDDEVILTENAGPFIAEKDVYVLPGGKLVLEAGVEIAFAKDVKVVVEGGFDCRGKVESPVVFKPKDNAEPWAGLRLIGSGNAYVIENSIIEGAAPLSQTDTLAAITAFDVKLEIAKVNFQNNRRCVYSERSDVFIRSCTLGVDNIGEKINIKRTAEAVVEDCIFNHSQGGDAIDFDRVAEGWILNNTILGGDDDGIDVGENCGVVHIEGNLIANIADNAITIAESSFAEVNYNVLAFCKRGLEAKDGGVVIADHNTIHGHSDIGVGVYELVEGAGGGTMTVSNSIISGTPMAYAADGLSEITFQYSLSDTEFLPGKSNRLGYPEYIQPDQLNFDLNPGSAAIDKGDPEFPDDPDGSRTDIGARYFIGSTANVLMDIFPNPFSAEASIPFYIGKEAAVMIRVYDEIGRGFQIMELGVLGEGFHEVPFNNYFRQGEFLIELVVGGKSVDVKRVVAF